MIFDLTSWLCQETRQSQFQRLVIRFFLGWNGPFPAAGGIDEPSLSGQFFEALGFTPLESPAACSGNENYSFFSEH